eukprot:jgi/Chrzof1/217/Cz01g07150.t1
MAGVEKKKPQFKKVEDLRPGTTGHNLHVKIQGVAYIEMGLTVVEIAQLGSYITLRNAKIDMYRGSMRLAVDQWGKVEESDVKDYEPKVDNNLSLIEYELVTVPTEAAA